MARFGSALADTGMMHEALAAQAGAGREFALARDRALADWEARRREQQQVTADQMLRLLPWPEVEAQTPTFADAARLLSDVKRQAGGFGLARSAETGRTTVRYLHSFAPATTIEEFIASHGPLPEDVALYRAPFWTASQRAFLKEEIIEDADWAGVIDELNARLH